MEKLAYCILMFHLGCLILGITSLILGFFRNIDVINLDNSTYNSYIKYYYLAFIYYPAQFGYKLKMKCGK